jgi:hypothetical protein
MAVTTDCIHLTTMCQIATKPILNQLVKPIGNVLMNDNLFESPFICKLYRYSKVTRGMKRSAQ